jgi:NAD(P)-dependent dehydrogenase (short-subunit alcohol dehydrogenase family)
MVVSQRRAVKQEYSPLQLSHYRRRLIMSEFENKSIIVTGGANGIGRAICTAFAEVGAHVLCADVDEDAGAKLAEQSKRNSGEIVFKRADVADAKACRGLVDQAVEAWGTVDVLCNNVGIQPYSSYLPAHELPEEMWDRIIDVNLKSAFLMTKYAVPHMLKQGKGVIINTASVQGLQSAKGVSAYAASKGGILSLTRQLALEYAEQGVRVLAVNPGTIDTNMPAEGSKGMNKSRTELLELWGQAHPMNRVGTAEEVARVVLFLAGDGASFMTGESVCVDGGLMAKGAWA